MTAVHLLLATFVVWPSTANAQIGEQAVVLGVSGEVRYEIDRRSEVIDHERQLVPMASRIRINGIGHVSLYSEVHNTLQKFTGSTTNSIADEFTPGSTSEWGNLWNMLQKPESGDPYFGPSRTASRKASSTRGDLAPMLVPSDSGWVALADGDIRFVWSKDPDNQYRFVLTDDIVQRHVLLDTIVIDTSLFVSNTQFTLKEGTTYHWIVLAPGSTYETWATFQVAPADRVLALEKSYEDLIASSSPTGRVEIETRKHFWQEEGFGGRAFAAYERLKLE